MKTKYFLVGCATILVGIIIALIVIGLILALITLAYASWWNTGAVSVIIATFFILAVLISLLCR